VEGQFITRPGDRETRSRGPRSCPPHGDRSPLGGLHAAGFERWHLGATTGHQLGDSNRGQGRRRSVDLRFFRPALYRLSYLTSKPNPKWIRSAGATGFEPATSGLTGRRTLQAVLRPRDVADSEQVRGDGESIDLANSCSTSGGDTGDAPIRTEFAGRAPRRVLSSLPAERGARAKGRRRDAPVGERRYRPNEPRVEPDSHCRTSSLYSVGTFTPARARLTRKTASIIHSMNSS
jgi:hypothetical protein